LLRRQDVLDLELRYFLQHYPALVAQATGGLKRELARLLKPTLLVVDELGYLPIDKFAADGLFQMISQRYEREPPSLPPTAPSSSGRKSTTMTAP